MKYLITKIVFALLLIMPFNISAQPGALDNGSATISSAYCVSLNLNEPVTDFYEIDISHLGFSSELEAQKMFGFLSNNLVSYILDFSTNKVYINLHLDRTPSTENVHWWNTYLSTLC